MKADRRQLFSRLSKIQRSLITSIERNLWEAKPKLKIYTSKLNIPAYISETAWRIYMELAKEKLTMGRSMDGFIAASLYAAIRIHKFPIILDDVSDASMVPRHTLFRSLSMIIQKILPVLGLEYRPISPEKLVFVIGNKLSMPIDLQIKAMNLVKKISKRGIYNGKDPKGLTAAVLYSVAKETNFKKTQKEIATAAKVTEVTIRNRLKDIKSFIGNKIIIPLIGVP
ncbi:MAG: transcription initiation factor IIB [Promethearchaeota archaeon]